jgi:hypothetical protein
MGKAWVPPMGTARKGSRFAEGKAGAPPVHGFVEVCHGVHGRTDFHGKPWIIGFGERAFHGGLEILGGPWGDRGTSVLLGFSFRLLSIV